MKKLLALVLALVMTLSLATVSTNAAFDDADNIEYTEAVEVMNAIGVLEGDGTGNFNPKGILNREQAAKIIASLLLTKNVANKLSVGEVKFADVKATDWAAPYIAYCAANGIVVGDGTNFYPTTELTGHAFAKMLLVAIGAKGNYTGADWAINVAVDAQAYDLLEGLDIVLSDKLTREEAAQMALNAALYTESGYVYQITVGKTTYSFDNLNDAMLYAALLEVDSPKLSKVSTDTLLYKVFGVTRVIGEDSFGRPATEYLNAKNKTIALFADEPDYIYAGADFKANLFSKGKALYDYADYTKTVVYNGGANNKLTASLKSDEWNLNILGTTAELYIDNTNKTIDVIISEGYFTMVTGKSTSLKSGVTTLNLTVFEAGYIINNDGKAKIVTVTSEDDNYDLVSGFAKYDVFMGFYNPGWDLTGGSALIAVDDEIETVEAAVKSVKIDKAYNGYVKTTDGDKLTFSNEYAQETVKVGSEGTFYLYNGYVVYYEDDYTSVALDDVFYLVKNWNTEVTNLFGDSNTTHYAQVVYLDGTTAIIEVDESPVTKDSETTGGYSNGLYYAKAVSGEDYSTLVEWSGEYPYYVATIAAKTKISSSRVAGKLGETDVNVRLNSDTVNVVAKGEGSTLKVATSNGILNAEITKDAIVIGKKSGTNVTAAYVVVPAETASVDVAGDLVYVMKQDFEETKVGDKQVAGYNVSAYDTEGDVVELHTTTVDTLKPGWYTYTTNAGIDKLVAYDTAYNKADDGVVTSGVISGSVKKANLYGELLTVNAKAYDIDISGAVVVDNYTNKIDTATALLDAINAGWTVEIDMYATNGGFVMIVINNIDE